MKKLIGYQKGVNLGGWLSQGKLDKEGVLALRQGEGCREGTSSTKAWRWREHWM